MANLNRREFLVVSGGVALALSGISGLLAADGVPGSSRRMRRPNIIFVLADDLGWGELGCYGNSYNETPNLDKLARQGMRFTNAYSAAPVCSPTRAAFMTGQCPARVGITDYLRPDDRKHLSTDYVTLPKLLKRAGYTTGLVGKWHLTGYANHGAVEVSPSEHGIDEVIVSENRGIGGGSYFHPYHWNREIQQRISPREYLTDRVNLEAVEFIERNQDSPFFLYVSHYAPHTGLLGKPDLVAKYEAKPGSGKGPGAKRNNPHLAAMLESMDEGIGMIVKKLDELRLTNDTILVFYSDNGGEDTITVNDGLRMGKSTLYEGGVRVPLIVKYPGVTTPGTTCDTPVTTMDFYPTFTEAAGAKLDPSHALDGISLAPVLRSSKASLKREALYWHYPLESPHFLGGRSASSIRKGDWKLIQFYDDKRTELYNLKADPSETTDLSSEESNIAAELLADLQSWLVSVGAAGL